MSLRHRLKCTFYMTMKVLIFFIGHSFFWISVSGKEHVPRKGALLVACSHSSYLDPPLVGYALPRILSYMARDTLFRHPLKWIIEGLFAYPISRDSGDLGALKTVQRLLKEGRAVLLFPEGTRSEDGRVKTFKPGIGFLAMRNRVPVLPVYIQGAYQSLPRHKKLPRPARIRVLIGEPLKPEDFASEPCNREGFAHITREIENRVKYLENERSL